MNAMIYNADLFCAACGLEIRARINREAGKPPWEDRDDSEQWPQFVDNGGGESDSPSHCGCGEDCLEPMELTDGTKVGRHLENPLTTDGREYVKQLHAESPTELTAFWMDYYDIDEDDPDDDDDDDDDDE